MAAFLPIAVLLSLLLVTGATAGGGYGGSQQSSSSSPSTTPTPYTAPTTTPNKQPAAHGGGSADDDDGKKPPKLVVVRVEGVVLCQSCAKCGSQSLDGAAPLRGANVTVTCRDRKNRVMAYRRGVADCNGYFHVEFGVERAADFWNGEPRGACFVRLLASPDPKCNQLTNINLGLQGAPVRDEGKQWTDDRGFRNVVFAAAPLAFRPRTCAPTHRY